MKIHCALFLVLLLGTAARAEDLSGYSGAQLYQRFCAGCHGAAGHGDGPVSASLSSMVPDLTLLARRHGGSFPAEQVRRIIDGRTVRPPHGERDMPIWGAEFRAATDARDDEHQANQLIDRLIDYLRSLQHR